MKHGTGESYISTVAKTLSRIETQLLVHEGVLQMLLPLPSGALIQWSSIFSHSYKLLWAHNWGLASLLES